MGFIPFFIMIFGGFMNTTAVNSNGGRMPVYAPNIEYSDSTWFTYSNFDNVKFPMLTDVINIGNKYISIGDIFLYMGFFLLIVSTTYISLRLINIVRFKKVFK
jgi:hypothetical protein